MADALAVGPETGDHYSTQFLGPGTPLTPSLRAMPPWPLFMEGAVAAGRELVWRVSHWMLEVWTRTLSSV